MTTDRVSDEKLKSMLAGCEGVTPGPWLYRPHKYDDWGCVRGGPAYEGGRTWAVANVRAGEYLTGDQYDAHRASHTDPYGDNAKHIAACDPDSIRSIVSELLALREAVRIIEQVNERSSGIGAGDFYAIREAISKARLSLTSLPTQESEDGR